MRRDRILGAAIKSIGVCGLAEPAGASEKVVMKESEALAVARLILTLMLGYALIVAVGAALGWILGAISSVLNWL